VTTIAQLVKKKRTKWKRRNKHFLFQGRPFTKVKVLLLKNKSLVQIMTPRKPNSAKRRYVRVGWWRPKKFGLEPIQFRTNAYIPGQLKSDDVKPTMGQEVLIRGGRVNDLPGMKYTIVRGHKKSLKGLNYRRTSRSKYGTPFWYLSDEERAKRIFKNFRYT
jgi:small subunit ribosomal protein S12